MYCKNMNMKKNLLIEFNYVHALLIPLKWLSQKPCQSLRSY
jgi:hypothetical protein